MYTKRIKEKDNFIFILFCMYMFFSQFDYILSFSIGGITISPVKIILPLLIILNLKNNNFIIKLNKKSTNTWMKMMLIWIIWTIASFLWAKSKSSTLIVLSIFIEGFFYVYYGKLLINSKKRLQKILNILYLSLFIHFIICFLEINNGIYLFSDYTERYLLRGYPVSTFTNTNNFACYLSMMFFLILANYHLSNHKKNKIIYIVLMLISLYFAFRCNSRASMAAICVGFMLYIILSLKNVKFSIVSICAIFLIIISISINPTLKTKYNEFLNKSFTFNTNATYGSDYYRINAYLNGIDFFISSYGIGISPGNVGYWMENYGTRFTNNIKPLHNWWLEIPVTSGIFVSIMMIYTWIKYYLKLFKVYANKNNGKKIYMSISAIMAFGASFSISSFSPSSLYKTEWAWSLLGLFFLFGDFILQFYIKNKEFENNG